MKSNINIKNPLQQIVFPVGVAAVDAVENLLPQMDGGFMAPAPDEAPGTMTQS
jgi:hypothetical protein